MQREHIQARVHPKVLVQMECIQTLYKHKGWGGVIEEMAKMIWDKQFTWLQPGKYERDTKEVEVKWSGSKDLEK